jgi:hypothetical protein
VSYLRAGDEYACATVLLSLLHHLRSLRLDFKSLIKRDLPGQMLRHAIFGNASESVSRFLKLEKVYHGNNTPYLNMETAALISHWV